MLKRDKSLILQLKLEGIHEGNPVVLLMPDKEITLVTS